MSTLVKLAFTHYGPKDSEDGIKAFLIVESDQRLIAYIKAKYLHSLDDYAEDDASVTLTADWIAANPNAINRAKEAGLSVETKYGWTDVSGNKREVILALQGNTAFEEDDCYYGVTHYDWSDQRQISEAEAVMLVRLGVATRI